MHGKTGPKKSKLGGPAYHDVVEESGVGKMTLRESCQKMLFVS